ncbi:peptide methionine sulfoxide reductase isoform X1 [Drosophila novamexicana]|uniref:peptide methionine sulfoxide reductase isoform X1 n=1 Tax=Drosophila novamexicana TaxID=47314 RepID=UPI0011E5DA90|nr:peptide methionine sulfoxide reductase isoform X1 [Drosophila novamexicana]XP_032291311.1 peptide methionine sulfoxide reductase isoform X2 [Drosophila virilis]
MMRCLPGFGYGLTFLFLSTVRNEQKELNLAPVHRLNVSYATATFGMGCFWGAESLYGATRGVLRTTVGYAGGSSELPTYRKMGDHTEVLEIDYDPTVISFKELLDLFWNNHEYGLTKPMKRQYASLILYHDDEQKQIAEASKLEEQERRVPEVITTNIAPKENFYAAEDYHQKYRLQGHKDLAASLNLNQQLLQTSYVATKLNGYLAGVGGIEQFKSEVETLGLTPTQRQYCNYHIEQNEGQGLYC